MDAGAFDIVAYLAADCKAAALAERSGRDTPEDGMNRLALYLAHSLHAVAASPNTLRANDVCHPQPPAPLLLQPPWLDRRGERSVTCTEVFGSARSGVTYANGAN